ncbi:hypothetical protein AB0M36_29605 [Actinoplanes sp. NPDC051346]|uniref:hypothetical protein n=1 Tax=Actinoplanes sp. NPDC051346 TaxID=3155048 RepID=UPI00343B5EDE
MGNSATYRIHTGEDVREAYAMARGLLALAETTCNCPSYISADVQTGTHAALDRYLVLDSASMALSVPADLVSPVTETLRPHRGPNDQPSRRRDGGAYLRTKLTPAVIAALRRLPPMAAEILTPDVPLSSDLPDRLLAVLNADSATISWHACWPESHSHDGFELGVNGAELWHLETPAGHSVYVHVSPWRPEDAHELAAKVGGRVIGEPATGW